MKMLFERRIVLALNNHEENEGSGMTQGQLLNAISNRISTRINRFAYDKRKFTNKVSLAMKDLVAPPKGESSRKERNDYYIGRDDKDDTILLVTQRGRDFVDMTSLGFMEEFIKRRKRSTGIIITILLSQVFLAYLLGFIANYKEYITSLLLKLYP